MIAQLHLLKIASIQICLKALVVSIKLMVSSTRFTSELNLTKTENIFVIFFRLEHNNLNEHFKLNNKN